MCFGIPSSRFMFRKACLFLYVLPFAHKYALMCTMCYSGTDPNGSNMDDAQLLRLLLG